MERYLSGMTILYSACVNNTSIGVVSKLIEVGGKELIIEECGNGKTLLNAVCVNKASIEVILKLVAVGGIELVKKRCHYGKTV